MYGIRTYLSTFFKVLTLYLEARIQIRIPYKSERYNPDPDLHKNDKHDPDPDPHQSAKQDPDQSQSDADPQHCSKLWIIN
jgi:hypothetical protein